MYALQPLLCCIFHSVISDNNLPANDYQQMIDSQILQQRTSLQMKHRQTTTKTKMKTLFWRQHFQVSGVDLNPSSSNSHTRILSS